MQPRSQGLSSLPPLSLRKDNGSREERPWERGCSDEEKSSYVLVDDAILKDLQAKLDKLNIGPNQ